MNIKAVLSEWGFVRWTRLSVGIVAAVQAFQRQDMLLGGLGAFLLFQAITNTGCCGSNGCVPSQQKQKQEGNEEVTFEEIK